MTTLDYNAISEGAATADTNSMPSYNYAADNHNYLNGNFAVTDPTTWGDGIGNAGKFIVSSVASGLNSFYNTGATVANWFGADVEQNDVATQLGAIDDDLGQYYQAHRQGADLAGFVLTSLVPGLGGVKLLNAGQKILRTASETGMIGGTLSKATGLLAPQASAFTKLAAADIAQSSATFSAISTNTIKAIASGYGQSALEGAAFEIAVTATSFKSPVLDHADGWDIAKNVALGAVTGGIIGGAFQHASTLGAIKKGVRSINPAEKLFTDTSDLAGLNPSQRIMVRQSKLDSMPEVPTAEEIATGQFQKTTGITDGLEGNNLKQTSEGLSNKFARLKEETQISLNNNNRTDIHELTTGPGGKDKDLANVIADQIQGINSTQAFANFEKLTELGRVSTKLEADKELATYERQINSKARALDADALAKLKKPEKQIAYIKLTGENAGNVTLEAPKLLNIADTVSTQQDVLNKVASYKFGEKKLWNAAEVKDHFEAEARYIWADRNATITAGAEVGANDIPLLEKAVEQRLNNITVINPKGEKLQLQSADEIYKHLVSVKENVAYALQDKFKLTTPEIAKITNLSSTALDGELNPNAVKDLFARQTNKSDAMKKLQDSNLYNQSKEASFDLMPTYAKAAYDTKQLLDVDGNVIQGMAYIKAQQKMYQSVVDNVFTKHIPNEVLSRFWHPGDEMLLNADRYGAGPGVATFANGGYNTAASWAESIGSATAATQKIVKNTTSEAMQEHIYNLTNNQAAAIEFESINKYLQSTSELYGINQAGTGLEPLKLIDYKAGIAAGTKNLKSPELQQGAKEFIPFDNPETLAAWNARTQLTGDRTTAFQEIRNAQGLEDIKDARAMRPIRPDPKDYPFYAVVVDPNITGVGHKSMIHAASAKELDSLISKVSTKFEVYKGDQLKDFFKSQGEFDWERTLHENYIDSSLRSSGVNNPFFVRTDPNKIAQSLLQDHLKSDDIFVRELINAKYEKEFGFMRQQGEQYTNTATSRYTGSFRNIENTTENPYINYIKTALNISQLGEHPYLTGLNNKLDSAVSSAAKVIGDAFGAAKSPADLGTVNTLLDKYGVSSAYYDAATQLLANHSAPKNVLTNFVSKANAILSTFVTRLDPFNSINNVVGATVLYGTEVKSVLRAMGTDNAELLGKLATPAPNASMLVQGASQANSDTVITAGKLLQQAVKNFTDSTAVNSAGEVLKDFYKRNGWITSLTEQHYQMIDSLALKGGESAGVLGDKLNSAFAAAKELAAKGEKLTGNKFAEELNRFVAADTMRQITDIGVKSGKITAEEQLGYINTFVNRTQGNTLASQRPLMFQGPVGQAIGLFQSFQFNTMQQLFRHVAEGDAKDAAMLLGLQGTMYGMNGLPAFNFINTHIVGTASGNPNHQDLYTGTYGTVGKSVGDLLLYGIPSNLLRSNLYSRGDINPRQLTVVPTNPADIPFINATIKMYDNVKGMLSNTANGGSIWQTFLQGIEHNGLSRPLAGLAQTAQAATHNGQVFSTTGAGNISGSNDFFSWATATRLAGGKPFDEAVANDAVFRMTSYQAADRQKMVELDKAVRSQVIGGGQADTDSISNFAKEYASIGGNQVNFNKYMMTQIKEANTSKANKIMEQLKKPSSQKMQEIMGGQELIDGRSSAFTPSAQ